ncbi:hypothetical protein [Mesorhizobium sp. M0019]|uniref:hypothetical protein n=1 Tax=Mesorhizobium sp. M0019 TaxID=2956845 RepID=UPI00333B609A
MQKINIFGIVGCHLRTLSNSEGKILWSDMALFYGLPLVIADFVAIMHWNISGDAFDLSITVFSIFAALLLSVQVALYGVSLRAMNAPKDDKKIKSFNAIKASRNVVIKELNDNISYLIMLAVVLVTVFLAATAMKLEGPLLSAFAVGAYVHFFLTLLVVVKRASIVFSREYEAPPT